MCPVCLLHSALRMAYGFRLYPSLCVPPFVQTEGTNLRVASLSAALPASQGSRFYLHLPLEEISCGQACHPVGARCEDNATQRPPHNVTGEGEPRFSKDELSTGQATGQMANKRVYAFIFQKMLLLGG